MWLLNHGDIGIFSLLVNTCSAIGTCIYLVTYFTHVFTAGFVKPGLEILPKHYKSILRVSFACYAAISCLKLSVAPVKRS